MPRQEPPTRRAKLGREFSKGTGVGHSRVLEASGSAENDPVFCVF